MAPCRLLAGHHFVWLTSIFWFQQNSNNHSTKTKSIGGLLAAQIKVLFSFLMTHVEIFILSWGLQLLQHNTGPGLLPPES